MNARSLTPEMLEQYEYIRITASFTSPSTDNPSMVYPICTLGNAAFAERIISEAYAEEEESEEETNESSSDSSAESSDPFYTDNSISFYAYLNNAEDLNLFPNLRYVSIIGAYDAYTIEYNASLYSYYNQFYGGSSFDASSIIQAIALSSVKNLDSFSELKKLEYLSLSHSSLTSLKGISKLTSLKVLDLTSSSVADITAVGESSSLEELYLAATNVKDLSPLTDAKALKNAGCRRAGTGGPVDAVVADHARAAQRQQQQAQGSGRHQGADQSGLPRRVGQRAGEHRRASPT